MKKIFHTLAVALLATAALQTACTEKFEYTPASLEDGGNVFITGKSSYLLGYRGDDPLVFKVYLQRSNDQMQEEVKLTSDNPKINVPATVTFQKGEKKKVLEVPFQSPEASTMKITISVDPKKTSRYGKTKVTYVLEHYKVHKVDYRSRWFNTTQNGLDFLEAGDHKFKLKLPFITNKQPFYPVEYEIKENGDVYVNPQPIYYEKDGNDNWHLLFVNGNWSGNDFQKFKDADVKNTSHLAGKYDRESGIIQLNVYYYAPNFGWWKPSEEQIAFTD